MGCGCADRQAALNQVRSGLGDKVKAVIDAVREGVLRAFAGQ